MVSLPSLSFFNPACYIPSTVNSRLPSLIACPPPPSYFTTAYNAITHPFGSTYSTVRAVLETLVGLPFLSLILIPTTGSWSTTVNFFFFYLTWYTLILSHPPLRVELIGSLAIRVVFYLLPSAAFFAFDYLVPSAAKSAKAQGSLGLPLRDASRSRTLKYLRVLGWSLSNVVIASLLQLTLELILTRILGYRSALRVSTTLPTPFALIVDVARGYLVREVLTYFIHRKLLHGSSTYLAKLHQDWYHKQIDTPFPLSASYDHPLPYLLHSFLPTYLPAFLFRFHLLTYLLFLTLVSIEETFAHSGYSRVPTNFIFGGIGRRTDMHVLCDGKGNFGRIGILDWIMGTTVGPEFFEDVRDELESHDVEGKARRGAGRLKDKTKERVNGMFGDGDKAKERVVRNRRQRSES